MPEVEKGLRRIDGSTRRVTAAIVFTVLFAAGVALRIAGDDLSLVLFIASAPIALYAIGLFRIP
jgi:hypothetical protein